MRFSVLHISDLHRDLSDEVDNSWLIESFVHDFGQYAEQDPPIMRPALCIVSGDLVFGVKPNATAPDTEVRRQYSQTEEFLVRFTDRFFDGNRDRIVILPGNHDVSFAEVIASATRIDIPTDQKLKMELVAELRLPNSLLRWSWRELCFYRITDQPRYRERFRYFAETYERFYQGKRQFSLIPERQYEIFDFPDIGFCVVALNSCYNNDPFRPAGKFHPATLAGAAAALRQTDRIGWVAAAAWHHNLDGGPAQDNYLDAEFLQLLIDAGVTLGFHGHQHLPECIDERYRLGPRERKITIISASTLCAAPRNLQPGIPRSFNVVELDTNTWSGRVHQRQMVNGLLNLPVWGPGHFNLTNLSYIDFDLCKPPLSRPSGLDVQLMLDKAESLIGSGEWSKAADILEQIKDNPLSRPLLTRALDQLGDARRTIETLSPPESIIEAVTVGGAILDNGNREDADKFVHAAVVTKSEDASVREISRRVRERWLK